ncbi:short-chain dehydrogenase, partial [Xanthomonas oryzae pv. oryzae]
VLLGRKLRPLERLYDAVAALGSEPLLYPLDLAGATPDDYATLAQRLQTELGGLHGLLQCAADFAGL